MSKKKDRTKTGPTSKNDKTKNPGWVRKQIFSDRTGVRKDSYKAVWREIRDKRRPQ
jgi:hypothetical protein